MIRHIVLVRLDPATPEKERQAIFDDLAGLASVVAGMRDFKAAENSSPEGLNRGYTHAFTIDFDTAAARDAYLVHTDHQAAGARLVRSAVGGVDGILVLDINC